MREIWYEIIKRRSFKLHANKMFLVSQLFLPGKSDLSSDTTALYYQFPPHVNFTVATQHKMKYIWIVASVASILGYSLPFWQIFFRAFWQDFRELFLYPLVEIQSGNQKVLGRTFFFRTHLTFFGSNKSCWGHVSSSTYIHRVTDNSLSI